MYDWTEEQENIIQEILYGTEKIVLIKARAGTSKSSTSVEAVKRYKNTYPKRTVRYLVYGRMAADEAKKGFSNTAIVSNLHQLAYHYIVKSSNMTVSKTPFVQWKSIPKEFKISWKHFLSATQLIDGFCSSTELSFKEYCIAVREKNVFAISAGQKILNAMSKGELQSTHDFYLKKFHIYVMKDKLKLDQVDLLIVDEANDITPITLDIVKKYPADKKILLGDPAQRIFDFIGCVDAFKYFPEAKTLPLSKSFRCSKSIAKRVEIFARMYFDNSFTFTGTNYDENYKIKTEAYISATNAGLINKMIECEKNDIEFKLATATKIKQMFEVPLAVISTKPGMVELRDRFKEYQEIVNKWHSLYKLGNTKLPKTSFLAEKIPDDIELQQAVKLIRVHGPQTIINAYNSAKKHKNTNASLVLLTAHTSKGATFDKVTLADSMNELIEDVVFKHSIGEQLDEQEITKLYTYYVAVTRARVQVNNATYL